MTEQKNQSIRVVQFGDTPVTQAADTAKRIVEINNSLKRLTLDHNQKHVLVPSSEQPVAIDCRINIEKIVDRRFKKGKIQYECIGRDFDIWVDEELLDCAELICAYEVYRLEKCVHWLDMRQ